MNNQKTKPGLLVNYRYAHGTFGHIWTYANENARDKQASDLAGLSHCVRVDKCDVKQYPNDTGCKTFDRQDHGPITGNVISTTHVGWYIRPRNETSCNGYTWKTAELQQADLKAFDEIDRGKVLRRYIAASPHFAGDGGVAYVIFHHRRERGRDIRVVHGALVTDRLGNRLRTIDAREWGGSRSPFSGRILEAVTPYLTNEIAINIQPVFQAALIQ